MRRHRVGGVGDDQLPGAAEAEVATQLLDLPEVALAASQVAVATVGGRRVARIAGMDDMNAIYLGKERFARVSYFAVVSVRLGDARHMARRLRQIKTASTIWVSNLAALVQARGLGSWLCLLYNELMWLLEGLDGNLILWEIISVIRGMLRKARAMQVHLLPGVDMDAFLDKIGVTVNAFPLEPAGRHAGPETVSCPPASPEACKQLHQQVGDSLDEIDALLDRKMDFLGVPDDPDSFEVRVMERLKEQEDEMMLLGKGKGNGNHVRGLEHLELLQSMASKGPLTEFCLAGMHLGDADDMARSLSCCIQKHKYVFLNSDRVNRAPGIRRSIITLSESLRSLAKDLRGGVINRPLLARMEQVESTLTSQILGQSPTGAFRDAAFEINSRLLDLLDHPGLLPSPGDGVLAQLVDHPGLLPSPGDIDGVLAQLVPLVDDLEQKVNALWAISIEYPLHGNADS